LRNVVIEKHTIGTNLLHYNALRSQESFIPLNKIMWKVVDPQLVERMKQLTGNQVELAINLLKFDQKFKPAIAHIFG